MPAFQPRNAVRWGAADASSLGKCLTRPRPRRQRFFGRNPRLPYRGSASEEETDRGGRRWGAGLGQYVCVPEGAKEGTLPRGPADTAGCGQGLG